MGVREDGGLIIGAPVIRCVSLNYCSFTNYLAADPVDGWLKPFGFRIQHLFITSSYIYPFSDLSAKAVSICLSDLSCKLPL